MILMEMMEMMLEMMVMTIMIETMTTSILSTAKEEISTVIIIGMGDITRQWVNILLKYRAK